MQNFLIQAAGGFLHSGKGHPKSHALSWYVIISYPKTLWFYWYVIPWERSITAIGELDFELWWSETLSLRRSENCREFQQWLSCIQLGFKAIVK